MKYTLTLLCIAALLSGCGGGGKLTVDINDNTSNGITNTSPENSNSSSSQQSKWWLPDNTQQIVHGTAPQITTSEINRMLGSTGWRDNALTDQASFGFGVGGGFGLEHDGNYTEVQTLTSRVGDLSHRELQTRTVTELYGVPFIKIKTEPYPHGIVGNDANIAVGVLDYASFGIWLTNFNGPILSNCCQWVVESRVTSRHSRSTQRFGLGSFTWKGAMVGAVKRDPQQVIMGAAEVELNIRSDKNFDAVNTLGIHFTEIKNLESNSGVNDMSWTYSGMGPTFFGDAIAFTDGDKLISGTGKVTLGFFGPDNVNAAGRFHTEQYLGAFGGTREE